MKINKHYDVNRSPREINSGEILVEMAGYVPAKARIESIIDAGKRLLDFRMDQFDSYQPHFNEEEFFDPTRSPNFDLVDAQRYAEGVKARMELAVKNAKEAKEKSEQLKQKADIEAQKAEKKAQDLVGKASLAEQLLAKILQP